MLRVGPTALFVADCSVAGLNR